MKLKYWFGFGFGLDRRINRYHMEEVYLVVPFLKVRILFSRVEQFKRCH